MHGCTASLPSAGPRQTAILQALVSLALVDSDQTVRWEARVFDVLIFIAKSAQ